MNSRERVVVRKSSERFRSFKNRTKVSNRRDILPNIDGRSYLARRRAEIEENLIADQGGIDKVSEVKLHLIRKFAHTVASSEEDEAAHARGEAFDRTLHAQYSSTLVRLARQIGIGRASKATGLRLRDVLSDKGGDQ